MRITVNLTPGDEARLYSAANLRGLAPEEFIMRVLQEHLPSAEPLDSKLDANLQKWQQQENTNLLPDRLASELFATWDKEAAEMSDDERDAEDRFWDDFQIGVEVFSGRRAISDDTRRSATV